MSLYLLTNFSTRLVLVQSANLKNLIDPVLENTWKSGFQKMHNKIGSVVYAEKWSSKTREEKSLKVKLYTFDQFIEVHQSLPFLILI